MSPPCYRGRFAPSPTGPLHAGSLLAALASWLDARAHRGQWLLRIEDVDAPRCVPGASALIEQQLSACGLQADASPLYQSQRGERYRRALDQLIAQGDVYPCACTRSEIAAAQAAQGHSRARHGELVYPGTCRPEQGGLRGRAPRAWRMRVPQDERGWIHWTDRALGPQSQHLGREVGDFVLLRADGIWAYQLAVVVDDAEQGISDVVRGVDLADNTPRQIWLQRALGLATPRYLHTPLVVDRHGEKLSKQNGAAAIDLAQPVAEVSAALARLGIQSTGSLDLADLLAGAQTQWLQAVERLKTQGRQTDS